VNIENIQLAPHMMLVRLDVNQGETRSGILVAEPAAMPRYRAEVIKVGPAVALVKPGDQIILKRYAGEPVLFDGEAKATYFIARDEDFEVTVNFT